MRYSWLALLLGIFLPANVGCKVSAHRPSTSDLDRAEIKILIEELASNFSPEYEDGEWGQLDSGLFAEESIDGPVERDRVRVRRAYDRLENHGITAFDQLVAASDDARYSFSQVYAAWRNHSVGDACFMLIEPQVDFYGEGYKSREGANGQHAVKPQYLWHVRQQIGLKKWWQDNRHYRLEQLQMRSLEWTIGQENRIGFVSQDQRERILSSLQDRMASLQETSP